ncbi:MAG TPA: alpha/beta family hydrolase [Frankiaceae bacterium]|nr:alpha/beta family hydrolase [Frankiaceae bacterium]
MTRNTRTLTTPLGDARVTTDVPDGQTNGVALLFHGAGGDSGAAALLAVRDALLDAGWRVARLDQPYVVAGRRVPAPAPRLDEVALLAVARVRQEGVPLLLAGKSSGARVGCRIATAAGAAGVVALGFPLHPPGRPEKSRAPELNAAGVPVLVLQGTRDTFGGPDDVRAVAGRHVTVHEVAGGDHSFRARKADGRPTRDLLTEVAAEAARFAQALT